MTPQIVPAAPRDAEAIAAMALDIWNRHYYPEVLSREAIQHFWNRMYRADVIRADMERGVVYARIEVRSDFVGFLAYQHEHEFERLRLNKLYVLPEYHGQGIGRLALEHVKSKAREHGVKEIYLYVFRKNVRAVRAYLRAGFRIERSEVTAGGDGFCFDDYVMSYRFGPRTEC